MLRLREASPTCGPSCRGWTVTTFRPTGGGHSIRTSIAASTIARAARHLLELISRVWDKVEPYIAIYACSVENFHEAHRQHLEILESIATRDLYSPSPSGRTGPQRGNSHLVNTHHYRLTTE